MRNKKRKGRPSNPSVPRYDCGKIKREARMGETEVQIRSTVLAYRARSVGEENARRNESGYELGRMYLAGVVNSRQHRAGVDYALMMRSWQMLMGLPSPFPSGLDYGAVRGLSINEDPDPEFVQRRTNHIQKMRTALAQAGRQAEIVVRQVCIEDLGAKNVDNLRSGLNALADFFKIPAFAVDEEAGSV